MQRCYHSASLVLWTHHPSDLAAPVCHLIWRVLAMHVPWDTYTSVFQQQVVLRGRFVWRCLAYAVFFQFLNFWQLPFLLGSDLVFRLPTLSCGLLPLLLLTLSCLLFLSVSSSAFWSFLSSPSLHLSVLLCFLIMSFFSCVLQSPWETA